MSDSILVVAPGWVGDTIMMQPMLTRLAEMHPGVCIDVLVAPEMAELVLRMPEVHATVIMPVGHGKMDLRSRFRLGRSLVGKYDWAIVLPNSLKSAFIPWFAGIPRRTGYKGEMRWGFLNDMRNLDPLLLPRMVDRFLFLADKVEAGQPSQYGFPELKVSAEQQRKVREQFNLSSVSAALCIGAEYGPAKRWPVSRFAELAQKLAGRGYEIFLMGSAKDQQIASDILRKSPFCKDLTGLTTLGQAVDILSICAVAVCNDSGLMHVAAALGLPLVALYGSSSPGFTPPLSKRARIISLNLDCSPCFKRDCPFGHLNCLNGITAAMVEGEIDGLLGSYIED